MDDRKIKILQNIALISGGFALLICLLVMINFVQMKRSDPLNSRALVTLNERLQSNPGDEQLRNEIRELDLIARKAYFTSTWQIRTGGILIFVSVLVIIICYQAIDLLRKKVPLKPATLREEIFFRRGRKRDAIMISGIVILVLTSAVVFYSGFEAGAGRNALAAAEKPVLADTVQALTAAPADTAQPDSVMVAADSALAPAEGFPANEELRRNFPYFRGYGSNGVAFQKNIPTQWDGKSGKNIRWKTKIPLPGYNSPIIWDGKIYLSGASESRREVYCVDALSGKIEWTTSIEKIPGSPGTSPKVNKETGYSASTLATDGRRVYAIFANGDLAALDLNGKLIWSKNLGLPKNHYGHSSSLITWQDKLIVQYDQRGDAWVAAYSGNTGDQVWKTTRGVKVSWASPILVNTGKRTELILAAEPCLASYDPSTGKELWKIDCISGEVGPSPAYANGIVFSINEYSKLAAVKLGDMPVQIWEDSEYLSDVPSPVATSKYLFVTTSYGTLLCYDALSGEKYWTQETGINMYASPVLVEGKIYQLDQKGMMHIFDAENAFRLIAKSDLGEGSFCTPAFTDGHIFIRGDHHLFCIGK